MNVVQYCSIWYICYMCIWLYLISNDVSPLKINWPAYFFARISSMKRRLEWILGLMKGSGVVVVYSPQGWRKSMIRYGNCWCLYETNLESCDPNLKTHPFCKGEVITEIYLDGTVGESHPRMGEMEKWLLRFRGPWFKFESIKERWFVKRVTFLLSEQWSAKGHVLPSFFSRITWLPSHATSISRHEKIKPGILWWTNQRF